VADGRGRYDRWRLARADARAAGSVPSIVVEPVRTWASRPAGPPSAAMPHGEPPASHERPRVAIDAAAIAIAHVARPPADDRPRGAGFGSLVHAVLARVPLDASRQTLADVSGVEARVLGLEPEDAVSASLVVERVLAHDVLLRARAAEARGACRRETPITCVLPDGTLLEGVVDLAFEHNQTWTVVDYKTDREMAAEGEAQYRRQVALYASAIALATGASCDGIVLVI